KRYRQMKMVKSLLLGSVAGLVAVSAGQAADLPVKANPIQYVKVCSLYGAGFYYMPGTDICLKIGGYVRGETTYPRTGNFAGGPTGGDVNNRTTNEFVMRARAYITADPREQTAWGTARAYVAVGVATTDVGNSLTPSILGFNRAFMGDDFRRTAPDVADHRVHRPRAAGRGRSSLQCGAAWQSFACRRDHDDRSWLRRAAGAGHCRQYPA